VERRVGAARLISSARFRSTLFGVVDATAPWRVRVTGMEHCVLYGVIGGRAWFRAPDVEVEIAEGDFLLLPRGVEHCFSSDRSVGPETSASELLSHRPAGEFVIVHGGTGAPTTLFAAMSVWDDYSRAVVAPMLPDVVVVRAAEFNSASHAAATVAMATAEARQPRDVSVAVMNRLMNLLLLECLTAFRAGAAWLSGAAAPQISRALHIIHTSTSDDWSTGALAQRVGLSRSAFTEKFKSHVGVSPGEYLQTRRLERAAALLRDTDIDVAAAAELVGYASAPSFTKAFRSRFNVSPQAYRLQSRRTASATEGSVWSASTDQALLDS
jgi:AraC-like DNA-binding protein